MEEEGKRRKPTLRLSEVDPPPAAPPKTPLLFEFEDIFDLTRFPAFPKLFESTADDEQGLTFRRYLVDNGSVLNILSLLALNQGGYLGKCVAG